MRFEANEYSNVYNALHPIAVAQRELEIRGGEELVGSLLSIIAEGKLADVFGVRLLHKHNDVSANEIMLESAVQDAEGFALVTEAVNAKKARQFLPNSWRRAVDGYVPIEFSESRVVHSGATIEDHRVVLDALGEKIVELGVSDILGPSLNYSEYVGGFAPSGDAAFLEKTDTANRANVVRFVLRSDEEFANSAKTKWHAKRMIDSSGKVVWMTACNCFCSVAPEGGHMGTTTHTYTKGKEAPED